MKKMIQSIAILLIFGSMFVGCTLYEDVDIEVNFPPTVADTILIPGWDTPLPIPPEIGL